MVKKKSIDWRWLTPYKLAKWYLGNISHSGRSQIFWQIVRDGDLPETMKTKSVLWNTIELAFAMVVRQALWYIWQRTAGKTGECGCYRCKVIGKILNTKI